jgi:hypothetical protein
MHVPGCDRVLDASEEVTRRVGIALVAVCMLCYARLRSSLCKSF